MDYSSGFGFFVVGSFYYDVPDGRAVYLYTVLKLRTVTENLDLVSNVVSLLIC